MKNRPGRGFVLGLAAILASSLLVGCSSQPESKATMPKDAIAAKPMTFTALQKVPHDPTRFTQGLEFIGPDTMVESTGLNSQSKVIIWQVTTQKVIKEIALPSDQFGEGITQVDGQLVNLTWKNRVANVWSLPDLAPVKQYAYDVEGWGICYDRTRNLLWTSDGTDALTARDPQTFKPTKTIHVMYNGLIRSMINELECVDGKIWANVWRTNVIQRIDPDKAQVDAEVNLYKLTEMAQQESGKKFGPDQVLNGIAYHEASDTWFVTGKQWPVMYQIRIDDPAKPRPSTAATQTAEPSPTSTP